MWVELPQPINTLTLFFDALEHGIAIAPGCLFSVRDRYSHCLRMSAGMPWNEDVERALQTLGNLAKQQLQNGTSTRTTSTRLEKI
jgi:DNA-binding transcriptional MocR family regulator